MDLSMQKGVLKIRFYSVAVKSNSELSGKKKYDNFINAS